MSFDLIPDYSVIFGDKFINIYELSKCYNIPTLDIEAALVLKSLVMAKKPGAILEIGCGAGASTEILNYSDKVELDAIDANPVRLDLAKKNFTDSKNVKFYLQRGEDFLKTCNKKYDFVFVDSIKRQYQTIFHLLKKNLDNGATVVFDDFMFYGYFLEQECEIPSKYQLSIRELREFYSEVKEVFRSNHALLNAGNGMLVINYEC